MNTHLLLDRTHLATRFPDKPFPLRHRLQDHPLFALPRLVDLARQMERDRIEYSSGDLSPDQKPDDIPKIDLSAEETIRQIEHCHAWMVIKNIESDPEYRRFLEGMLREAHDHALTSGKKPEPMSDIRGFVFVSSANSVTPFHVDAEHNMFVQIHGDKFMHIFENEDRSLVSEEAMEISPSKHRNQHYEEAFEGRAKVYAMREGDGVFLPYMWPHWVRTGDRYSVSVAITWKTPSVERLNKIRFMNGFLRRVGIPQAAPDARPRLDGIKVAAFDALQAVVEPLRKSERSRRFIRQILFGRKANYYYET